MKIQEMRSGIPLLSDKDKAERNNVFEMRPITEPVFEEVIPSAIECELDRPIWSVISFDEWQAGGLTYKQAHELLLELEANDVAGLCIITDEAANRRSA